MPSNNIRSAHNIKIAFRDMMKETLQAFARWKLKVE